MIKTYPQGEHKSGLIGIRVAVIVDGKRGRLGRTLFVKPNIWDVV